MLKMPNYVIRDGDCVINLAEKNGLSLDTIWDHPQNAALRETRTDKNVLLPGDILFIPERQEKTEDGSTNQRHRFRKRGTPARLRLQLMNGEDPISNEDYILLVEGNFFEGTTDADGRIEQRIPPDSAQVKLRIGQNFDEYHINLGHIDPPDYVSGAQGRLKNLGFYRGQVDGELGAQTEAALRRFQSKYDLDVSGVLDDQTCRRLQEIYGS
jgi:hypothetical protein